MTFWCLVNIQTCYSVLEQVDALPNTCAVRAPLPHDHTGQGEPCSWHSITYYSIRCCIMFMQHVPSLWGRDIEVLCPAYANLWNTFLLGLELNFLPLGGLDGHRWVAQVFCSKRDPNCSACPLQDQCEYALNNGRRRKHHVAAKVSLTFFHLGPRKMSSI